MNSKNKPIVKEFSKELFDRIFEAENPKSLVQKLEPLPLLSMINELGEEDSLELLELLQPEQVLSLFDLTLWEKDRLNTQKAGDFLCLLFEANHEVAMTQLFKLDREFLGLMFRKVCHISDVSLGEHPDESKDIYSQSPDGRFYVTFSDKKADLRLSKCLYHFLEQLYGKDMSFALNLLEDVRFENLSGLEESAFVFRNHRISDLGILPYDEALSLIAYLTPNGLRVIKEKYEAPSKPALMTVQKPHFGTSLVFVEEALKGMSDEEKTFFMDLFCHTAFNIHYLITENLSDTNLMGLSMEYVAFLLDLGLMKITNNNKSDAHQKLEQYGLRQMIRLGRSTLQDMRNLCFTFLKGQEFFTGKAFSHLDSPLREVARGLCFKEPLFYEGLINEQKLTTKLFSSHSELTLALMACSEIKARCLIASPMVLGFHEDEAQKQESLSHASILARVLVNKYLQKDTLLNKVSSQELPKIFQDYYPGKEPLKLNPEVVDFFHGQKKVLWEKVLSLNLKNPIKEEKVDSFVNALIIKLEQNHKDLI